MTELVPIIQGSLERAPWGWALLTTVLIVLIKMWPAIALQAQQARDALRKERRDDLSECQKKIEALTTRLDRVEATAHGLEMKLLGAITAYKILDAEVEARFPESSALAQARIVMSTAFTISPSTEDSEEPKQ